VINPFATKKISHLVMESGGGKILYLNKDFLWPGSL